MLNKQYLVVQNKVARYMRNIRTLTPSFLRDNFRENICFLYSGTYSIELQTVFGTQDMWWTHTVLKAETPSQDTHRKLYSPEMPPPIHPIPSAPLIRC